MQSVEEIIERIKDLISLKQGDRPISDKDIAIYIDICPKKLSYYKKNNMLPYEEIFLFCVKEDIEEEWLLFSDINYFES